MKLYVAADHLDRASQDLKNINVLIDMVTEHIINAGDLEEPEGRETIVHAMLALSDIAEDAHARAAAALASCTISPHDFSGDSFRL